MHNNKTSMTWAELRDATASCFILAALVFLPLVAPAYLEELNAARDFIMEILW